MPQPYEEYEGTALWQALDSAIRALEGNQDLVLTTAREYVIGFLCRRLVIDRLVTDPATKGGESIT